MSGSTYTPPGTYGNANEGSGGSSMSTVSGTVTANQGTGGNATPWTTTDSNGGQNPTGVALPTGGTGFLGWLGGIYSRLSGTLAVKQSNVAIPPTQLQLTAGTSVVFPTTGFGSLGLYIAGLTGTGAVVSVTATPDGVNFVPLAPMTVASQGSGVEPTTVSANGNLRFNTAHYTQVVFTCTTAATSSASATIDGTMAAAVDTPEIRSTIAKPVFSIETSLPITAAAMPAGGTGVIGWLSAIWQAVSGTLTVKDPNNANYSLWPPIIASAGGTGNPPAGTYTPPAGTRSIGVNCTAAATIQMTDSAGNVQPWQITVGSSILPFMPATFTLSSGTATFYGVR